MEAALIELFTLEVRKHGWEAEADDLTSDVAPLPPPAPVPVPSWYEVRARPLLLNHLEQAILGAAGASAPDVQFRPAPSDINEAVQALLPPWVASDLTARGIVMVQAGPSQAEYRIPAHLTLVDGPTAALRAQPQPEPEPSTQRPPASRPLATPDADVTLHGPGDRPAPRRRPRRRRPAATAQCYRCQRWGHKSDACASPVDVCRVCSGAHRSAACNRNTAGTLCANCGSQAHRASSHQCAAFPRPGPRHTARPSASSDPLPKGRPRRPAFPDSLRDLLGPLLSLVATIAGISEPPDARSSPRRGRRGRSKKPPYPPAS